MNAVILNLGFARLGARLSLAEPTIGRRRLTGGFSIDVRHDADGELFEIAILSGARPEFNVLDVRPDSRHLLLLAREEDRKSKFLCGHDERHWFVAAIPEDASAGTVIQAMEALKPPAVQREQNRRKLSGTARARRKNAVYVRQGEWFFLPQPGLRVNEKIVLADEPLSRGIGSKPHWAEYCYRLGGEAVMVTARHPGGVSTDEYRRILKHEPSARRWGWQALRRNPQVYVRGRTRHPDHRAIRLHDWHQVLMNTENQAVAMASVAFLD